MEDNFIPPNKRGTHEYETSIPPPKGPYDYDHHYNVPHNSPYLSERTIGIMLNKIENLEDATRTATQSITDMILARKDFDHVLDSLDHRMDRFDKEMKELKEMIKSLGGRIDDHVEKDTPITEFVTTKLGKWMIAIFGIAISALLVEIVNRVKPFIFRK